MRILHHVALILFLTAPVFGQTKSVEDEIVINEKVSELLQQMRDGNYRHNLFPELTWDDVPSLMQIAESELVIANTPTNPLSSFRQTDAREGVIALWLVEGIRQGSKFPSLNCMLVDGESNLPHNHPSLHSIALDHYQKWWKQVEPKPVEEDTDLAPMTDSKLRWY